MEISHYMRPEVDLKKHEAFEVVHRRRRENFRSEFSRRDEREKEELNWKNANISPLENRHRVRHHALCVFIIEKMFLRE